MEKLSKWLIIAAVISLPIKRGIIKPYSLQLFEFLIILAAITLFIFLIAERDNKKLAAILPWVKLSAFFMAFLMLGSFFGYALYGTNPIIIKDTIVDLFLLLTTLSAFLLVIYHGKNNPKFRKHILLGFLSSIIFIPFVFMPDIAEKLTFLHENYFWGLHQGTATFAGFMLIPLTYLTVLFVQEKFGFKKILYWIIAILMFSIILWTGIRSAWLGMFLIISFITTYLAWEKNALINKLKHAIKLVLIFSISAVISFSILPNIAQTTSIARLFPQFKESGHIRNLKISIPNQARGEIWPQAIKLLLRSPFGLGTQYHETSKAIGEPFKDHLGNYKTRYTGAHNAFLTTGLMGGVGALIIFTFIIYTAIKNIIRSTNKDIEWMVLGGNLIGLLTIAFFQGIMLGFPWAWIILALIFARETPPNSLR